MAGMRASGLSMAGRDHILATWCRQPVCSSSQVADRFARSCSPLEGDCRLRADTTTPGPTGPAFFISRPSRVQALAVQPLVEIGDIFGVAVEQQRGSALAEPDQLLARLAPARMRHLGVDVGPEAVFGRLQRLPKALRPLIREAEAHH